MYFNYKNGEYIQDDNGILCGVQGIDINGNDFRAIAYMPLLTSLQFGQNISYIYVVQLMAVGTEKWVNERNETLSISNSEYINTTTGEDATLEEAARLDDDSNPMRDEEGNPILKNGYSGQLDYFIASVCKGEFERIIIYDQMMDAIIANERKTQPSRQYKK